MAPHSSALAWKIPWTEEPGRLLSMGSLELDGICGFFRMMHEGVSAPSCCAFTHRVAFAHTHTGAHGHTHTHRGTRTQGHTLTHTAAQRRVLLHLEDLGASKVPSCREGPRAGPDLAPSGSPGPQPGPATWGADSAGGPSPATPSGLRPHKGAGPRPCGGGAGPAEKPNPDENKETGTLIHYHWQCKIAQPLCETVRQFFIKLHPACRRILYQLSFESPFWSHVK